MTTFGTAHELSNNRTMEQREWLSARELPIEVQDLILSPEELRITLGYGEAEPGPEVQEIIDHLTARALDVCHPRSGFRIVEGYVEHQHLILAGLDFDPGAIIAAQLRKGTCFAVFIASIGTEMDTWLHDLREGDDIVSAYIADALGSVMAEAIVVCGLNRIEQHVTSAGLRITNPYSPGYCGWDVSEQHALFSLLPENFCGVQLGESGLMLPIKSVSAVIGIGPDVERRDYGCALCRKADCYKRKLK